LQAASGGSRDPGAQVSTEAGPEPRVERARCGHYGTARAGCRARGRAQPAATPVAAPARSLDVLHLLAHLLDEHLHVDRGARRIGVL
jgi:hypothetical protein